MQIGDVVVGRYRLERLLGRGGSGTVWLAEDLELGRRVAVKAITDAASQDPQLVARVEREARLVAGFSEPSVVQLYDIVRVDGLPLLVMEYLPGGSLAERLTAEGPMPPAVASRIVGKVAQGLARAHAAGVLHRDIKPGNILLSRDGDPKIADFGIALAGGDDRLTTQGSVTGTVGFMAPELLEGGDPTPATDAWALGITYVQLLTGRAPFDGPGGAVGTMQRIVSQEPDLTGVPDACAGAVLGLLARDPEHRMSCAAAGASLLRLADRQAAMDPGQAATTTLVPLPGRGAPGEAATAVAPVVGSTGAQAAAAPRRSRRGLLLGGLAALLLVGGIGGAAALMSGSDGDGGEAASTTSSTSTTDAPSTSSSSSSSSTSESSSSSSTSESSSSSTSSTTSSTTSESSSPSTSASGGKAKGKTFTTDEQKIYVIKYLRLARTDSKAAWAELSPLQQAKEGTYEEYAKRWAKVKDVDAQMTSYRDMTIDSSNKVTYDDGTTSRAYPSYDLEVVNGKLRIHEIR